jgi:uncharacterized protein YjiS (DUF1127 family)
MSDRHIGNPTTHDYIDRARRDRADALARAGHLLITAVVDAAVTISEAVRQWHERRRATHELLSLDDRLLQDIGITRGEIWAAVHGALSDRGVESAPAAAPAADIALTPHAIAGCNDNERRRRAA